MVPAGPGCENEVRNKKVKRHMVFLLFYCISFRCRLLEGFSCGLFFCVSFSCRLLEASGSQDHFAKQNEKASGISRTSLSNNFCKKKDVQTDCHGGPGGIRASDHGAPSLNCLVVHSLGPLKIQNPRSKIQNPESKI